MYRRMLMLVLLIIALGLSATVAHAQGGPDPDEYPEGVDPTDVYRISRHLYCDVCAGVPLADCPSTQCQVWREEIALLLSEGKTDDEIREHFADRYGEQVSGVPLDNNDRILVFLLPLGISLVAVVLIGWRIYLWRGNENNRALQAARSAGVLADFDRPVPDNVDPVYIERVLADLEALRR